MTMSSRRRLAGLELPSSPRKPTLSVAAGMIATTVACLSLFFVGRSEGQPYKYMTGAEWKDFLCGGRGECSGASWFSRWNRMMQARIDQLAAIAEAEGRERGNAAEPFRVTMVGDSTMMQQYGVICAFLGERPGRRFDPERHQPECCIDTLPEQEGGSERTTPGDAESPVLTVKEPGRGLCFQHAFQRFAAPPDEDSLGSPDAVYFGNGLHFLHMCRPQHPLEPARVQGWLTYEEDLETAVDLYREAGGYNLRLIFMTPHIIQDSKYVGDFAVLMEAYHSDDAEAISLCEKEVSIAAGDATGPDGYGKDAFCRQALMDRNGSEVLGRRSRSVMERLGIPLVEGDLIVRDQAWATAEQDGRHYHELVPVEVWELMGLLVSPFHAIS